MIAAGIALSLVGLVAILVLSFAQMSTAAVFFGLMALVGLGNGLILPNATVGMLMVKPELVGSASGLGAAIMTGGGAVLSVGAGFAVYEGAGVMPITGLMTATFILVVVLFGWSQKLSSVAK